MIEYIYKAKNMNGNLIKGKFNASDPGELMNYLHSKGYYLTYYRCKNNGITYITNKHIRIKDVAVFCRQFSIILQSGISIIEALSLLSFQSNSKALREALSLLMNDVRNGESLYNGFVRSKYSFPDFMVYMMKIGEESGKLDEIMEELASYYERDNKINKKVVGALSYPVTVFIITIIITMILMVTVVPTLTAVLTSMGGRIPAITSAVIALSSFLRINLSYIMIIAFALPIVLITIIKRLNSDIHQRFLIKLPGFGKLYKKLIEIKFSRGLSILLGSGLNLINSLELTSNILGNKKVQSELSDVIQQITEGKGMYEALISINSFEPLMISMIKVGEETGRLDEMLRRFAGILEEETYELILKLTDFIQPALIMLLSCIVGTIIISIMLPMISMMDAI